MFRSFDYYYVPAVRADMVSVIGNHVPELLEIAAVAAFKVDRRRQRRGKPVILGEGEPHSVRTDRLPPPPCFT